MKQSSLKTLLNSDCITIWEHNDNAALSRETVGTCLTFQSVRFNIIFDKNRWNLWGLKIFC